MKNETIAGLTDEEIFRLESEDIDNSQRIEIESKLASYIGNNPKDLPALMLASGVISDPFMRNYYVMALADIARKGKDRQAYSLGIIASRLNGRSAVADELYSEMKRKHPVRARVVNLFSKILCKKYEKGSNQDDYPVDSGGKFS